MAQSQRLTKTSVATTWSGNNTQGRVTYHNTDVVTWDETTITLDTGGWSTATTKLRMNQASNHFGLGFGVYQKDYKWYVDYRGVTYPFEGHTLQLMR